MYFIRRCWFLKWSEEIHYVSIGDGDMWYYVPVDDGWEEVLGHNVYFSVLLSKCQRLNCIVRESNPGRPRGTRALYLKSYLYCKKRWQKTPPAWPDATLFIFVITLYCLPSPVLCFSSSVLCLTSSVLCFSSSYVTITPPHPPASIHVHIPTL